MDPITLFALANSAVSAVKAGCKLYKDIKGAAGEVKDVLKDLDSQFHKTYEGKPVPPEAKKQLQEEKARVIELNKKANADAHTGVYQEIGEHLGTYYDNYYKCMAVFEEEERKAKTEVYTGDDSIGKRALNRVLMRKQLEQMGSELREIMVYQSPPELGALWTEVEEMMKVIGAEQKILMTKKMQAQEIQNRRRLARRKQATQQAMVGMGIVIIILFYGFIMMKVAHMRQEMYPQYGSDLLPSNPNKKEEKYIYIGR